MSVQNRKNPLIHENRQRGISQSAWERSFACSDIHPLIICRGPIRMETMDVFEEMGITEYGILISEKDSITYANALSPELRSQISTSRVHRVPDYTGATREERTERIQQIISIALDNGYDSVFAGYGFMAEDEALVQSLEHAGLKFIGPQSSTIRQAGSKDLARRTALAVDIPVTPGLDNVTVLTLLERCPDQESLVRLMKNHELDVDIGQLDSIEAIAESILNASYEKGIDLITIDQVSAMLAYQVGMLFEQNSEHRIRLKAVGGGGGKGQRILNSPRQYSGNKKDRLQQAIEAVDPMYREVLAEVKANGVGDNKNALAELNMEKIRHQEIQVVGNGDWCITLGGRDCSLQMNEQKLQEISVTREELSMAIAQAECPETRAALVTDLGILESMELEAARFGAAVGLDSVSTFECIVDGDHHYFMEMNTRVQVEHRVTELCYALRFTNPNDVEDYFTVNSIVELMVLLAAHGKRLPEPERVCREEASLEVRLNATDQALKPHAGGVICQWSPILPGEIRDEQGICLHNPDTDVFMKYHLAGAYDANIALLLSTGESRMATLQSMAEILRRTRISGDNLRTNLQFQYGLLSWLLGQDVQARPTTDFVSAFLTATGQLKAMADNLDIARTYAAIEQVHVTQTDDRETAAAISEIMNRKATLLLRVINILFAEPHFLAGWLSLNRHRFRFTEGGIIWLSNPVQVLSDLYHYLNMEAGNGGPALYVIWDHDQVLLQDAIDFYDVVQQTTGNDNWIEVQACLSGEAAIFGSRAAEVRAAHKGFQLGLEILTMLPYIGMQTGFFDLSVLSDLSISIPDRFREELLRLESIKALSPPPVTSGDEITAPVGGMFYSREATDRQSFVQAGDHFETGEPLFIIEVMKMFNKVLAPFSGTIDKVLINMDATIVKQGQVVFKVTPDVAMTQESESDVAARTMTVTTEYLDFMGYQQNLGT